MKIQRCIKCDEPTGRCEEDSLYIGDAGPYCEECFDALSGKKASARNTAPSHYSYSEIQPWDVIDAWELNYYLGNVVKYVCRAGRKGEALVDLNKALHYLQKEVELAESCAFSRTMEAATDDKSLSWDSVHWPTLICTKCGEGMECTDYHKGHETLEYYCGNCKMSMFVGLPKEA